MVDCERALGRHDKALELAQSDEATNLAIDDRVELAIVVSGIRRDLGQLDAAAAGLSDLVKRINPNRPSAARLFYAYADAKLAAGDLEVARDWFARAADADHELTTDAAERLEELDGVDVTDLLGDEDDNEYGDVIESDDESRRRVRRRVRRPTLIATRSTGPIRRVGPVQAGPDHLLRRRPPP